MRLFSKTTLILTLLLLSCGVEKKTGSLSSNELDSFLGLKLFQVEKTGFFRVEEVNGRWWFITPEGHPFLSAGINAVSPYGYFVDELGYSPYHRAVLEKYGSEKDWAQETVRRLISWNFNTLGAWSSFDILEQISLEAPEVDELRNLSEQSNVRLPYTVILYISGSSWLEGNTVDFFSESFHSRAFQIAEEYARPLSQDPYLLGYFLDNEMRWGVDWRGTKTLFEEYFAFPSTYPGKVKLVQFLKETYGGDVELFNRYWCAGIKSFESLYTMSTLPGCKPESERARSDRSAFLEMVAHEYFKVARESIKKYDPNHLILGSRIQALIAPPEVVRACGKFSDVVSINFYDLQGPMEEWVHRLGEALGYPSGFLDFSNRFYAFYQQAEKPLLISEFGFRAADSGLPNTRPPGFLTLPDQEERAASYRKFVSEVISAPWVVGYHWFAWVDEPAQGRFDGENSNWGVVNSEDQAYSELVRVMKEVNGEMYQLHLGNDP